MLLEILNPTGTVQALYNRVNSTTDPILYRSLAAYLADFPATGSAPKVLLIPQVAEVADEPDEYREAYESEADEDRRCEEESAYYG